MKRTIIKVKSNIRTDEMWCTVNGAAFELLGGYLTLTENLIDAFKKEGDYGKTALKMVLQDVVEAFKENGIDVKELTENE